ncbi:MAG: SDR family oxidoreductase [Pseudomonadota bacterium]
MDEMFSVAGRVAVATGASSGIGRAMASALATRGAKVIGVARRQADLEAWVGEAAPDEPGARAYVVADMGDLAALPQAAAACAQPFGAPEIVIPAAGINPRKHADDVSLEEWEATLAINLSHPFLFTRELVPGMREKGWGRVINIASLQTFRAFINGIAYGTTKGGIAQLTRAMAEAWSGDGIMCNAIAPGFFHTALAAPVFADPALSEHHAKMTALGRNGVVEDLIGPMLFLASPASDYVTGQVLSVDGGYTAK